MDEQEKLEVEQASKFAKYRSKLKNLYGSEKDLKNAIGNKSNIEGLAKIKSRDAQQLFRDAISNPEFATILSNAAYYISSPYASIVNYYKTLFLIRYTIVPRLMKTEIGQSTEEYGKIYNRMVESIEGLNLETTLPLIAERTLIDGHCGIITERSTIGDTVATYILPKDKYKAIGKTQFGTNIIAFDYQYFRDLKQKAQAANPSTSVHGTNFESILKTMPKILQEGYKLYDEDNVNFRWQVLDPKVATMFSFNEEGIPPKLSAFPASIDYNAFRDIKLEQASQELNIILTSQIPTNSDGELIMDVDEVISVANSMRNALSDIKNLKLITTFGKTDVTNLQKNEQDSAALIDTAYNNIYSSSGVDYHVFVSDKDLEASINRDKAFMWDFYTTVMLFYNITTNNILNFSPYQAKINLLPISCQTEDKDIKAFIERAGAGVGRLQTVVAAGIKQIDLADNYRVEEFLDFDKILKPLQSMYTSSYKANNKTTDESKDGSEPKQESKPEEDEEAVDESKDSAE